MRADRAALANLNIENPLVAWLVYRGHLVSSAQVHEQALGFWLMRALSAQASTGHRAAVFEDELVLDALRATHAPDAVSRLRGLYLFDDAASAERAVSSWGGSFHREALVEVGIREDSRYSRHDAEWLTTRLGGDDRSWMVPYLQGEPSASEPIWELLVDGRAVVFGTELREAAYQVVKRAWPKTMALLELGRVAAGLGSDLGVIAPMVIGQPDDFRVDFFVNLVDAESPEFLERFGKYDGPKNTADLGPESALVLPDLRPYSFKLPAPRLST